MKMKKLLCTMLAALMVSGMAIPAFAETITFDVTVPGDILSRKALKADSEQRFYVTGTGFNKGGTLYCTSVKYEDASVFSHSAAISPYLLKNNAMYRKYAEPGKMYYMTTNASVSGLHVTGRYTP